MVRSILSFITIVIILIFVQSYQCWGQTNIPNLVITEKSYFDFSSSQGSTYVTGCSTFEDGSLRLFIVRKGISATNLLQKIIYSNGTEVSIPLDNWGLPMGIQPNTLSPISNTNVLFAYANGTKQILDPSNPIQKDTWAGIADEKGNLLKNVLLMENNQFTSIEGFGVNNTAHQLVSNGDNFIYIYYYDMGNSCETIKWKVYNNATTLIGDNTYNISTKEGCVRSYNAQAVMDGGFLITWSVTTTPSNFTDPTSPPQTQSQVYAVFVKPNSAEVKTSPFVIFSGTTATEIKILACAGSSIGQGFNCFLQLMMNDSANGIQPYQVTFLSSGMVHNVVPLRSNITNNRAIFGDFLDLAAVPLRYGGFLLIQSSLRQNPLNILNLTGTNSVLDLFNYTGGLLKEQTSNIVYTGIPTKWLDPRYMGGYSIYTVALPKFYEDDNGYQNLNILSSNPSRNEKNVPLTFDSISFTLKLTYRTLIILSDHGSINIYQKGYDDTPRLKIMSNSIRISSDPNSSTTLYMNLISSTLNCPETEYYVTVDDGMILKADLAEPLPGVKPNIWSFVTDQQPSSYSGSITVLLRFRPKSLQFFISNSTDAIQKVHAEISRFLPVNIEHLSTPYNAWYFDKGDNHEYILLPLQISPGDYSSLSSLRLSSDLEDLIKNSPNTNIGNGTMTSLLDSKYGAPIQADFWSENKVVLIVAAVIVLVVVLLYVAAEYRDSDARNTAVLQFALVLADFSDVPFLFVPSLIFSIVPFTFNQLWSIYIVLRESFTNPDFFDWFKRNTAVASMFTVLGLADVEVLSILNSRVAGIKALQAPWSKWAGIMIFIGSLVGFFIEDIPKFIIQVLYKLNTASYSVIPFLTLVTSSLVILHAIVGKMYLGIAKWRQSKRQYEPPKGGEDAWRELMSEVERLAKDHLEESKASIAAAKLAAKKKSMKKGGDEKESSKGGQSKNQNKNGENLGEAGYEGDRDEGGRIGYGQGRGHRSVSVSPTGHISPGRVRSDRSGDASESERNGGGGREDHGIV
ncbi:3903_t:CDS:10 [Cetraspora pellucida]|uniref:3903_t:CDS:1 n=1 Tax=Cetraspora pellucida TaxID=1433469 RepID=A0A9N8WJ14_9GLOM|nr:3903_t:CDS:10 [Cetraspora pellucida]